MGSAEGTPGTAFAEGVPCWIDAMLPDLEAGKRFYGALFGWTYGDPAPPARDSYTVAYLDGERAAALAHKPDGRLPTAWTVYFATSDAAAAAGRVRAAGGQLVTEPVPVGRAGTMATAVDPGGAAFGLWQAGALTGFLATRRPGAYVWAELFTRERETVDAFYTAVFGYGMYPAGGAGESGGESGGGAETGGEAPEIMVWVPAGEPADEEHAVGNRAMIDDTYPVEMPAHFLVHFAVADCDAAVRTAVRLGGRVVEEPRDTPFGRYAVLVDNQGARFGVLAPAESTAEPTAADPAV
ncbi:hydrolase [Streptomyces carminius]|uniref:Hydrolase n=1 Tax=Streptomyces carminius TaxID=2665496 RepID=A0A2M8M0D2_9ACTN|nr:VOC family protein [Streptomyces carminius]PJE97664.1 hydrolase [Streptomyces carminius]